MKENHFQKWIDENKLQIEKHVKKGLKSSILHFTNGTVVHMREGKIHRLNAPAIIYDDGESEFFRYGEFQKEKDME